MKSLKITLVNARCIHHSGETYRSFDIKGLGGEEQTGLEELVVKNLPEDIDQFKDFVADISINIKFKPLQTGVFKVGYKEETKNEKKCSQRDKKANHR